MKSFVILLIFLSFHLPRCCSQSIPPKFKLPVVFILSKDIDGNFSPNGTGFICSVQFDSSRSWLYLITAKHVIQHEKTQQFFDLCKVRINKIDGSYGVFDVVLKGNGLLKNIFIHEDPSVDLVAIPISLPVELKLDIKTIDTSFLFKSKIDFDTSYVKEGTSVFYTGMFSSYLGYKKNVPIVRFGRIALITDEKILWDQKEKTDLFLVETTTYGGNSGSPLFSYGSITSIGDSLDNKGFHPERDFVKLAGIIKGYYGEKAPLEFIKTSNVPTYTSNVGITGVIPSYLLYEILFSKGLVEFRKPRKK